jgi:hypothetical protein
MEYPVDGEKIIAFFDNPGGKGEGTAEDLAKLLDTATNTSRDVKISGLLWDDTPLVPKLFSYDKTPRNIEMLKTLRNKLDDATLKRMKYNVNVAGTGRRTRVKRRRAKRTHKRRTTRK